MVVLWIKRDGVSRAVRARRPVVVSRVRTGDGGERRTLTCAVTHPLGPPFVAEVANAAGTLHLWCGVLPVRLRGIDRVSNAPARRVGGRVATPQRRVAGVRVPPPPAEGLVQRNGQSLTRYGSRATVGLGSERRARSVGSRDRRSAGGEGRLQPRSGAMICAQPSGSGTETHDAVARSRA